MKFYRVRHYVEDGSSGGHTWTTSKDEAQRAVREHAKLNPGGEASEIEPVDITPTKAGILAALNHYAAHAPSVVEAKALLETPDMGRKAD